MRISVTGINHKSASMEERDRVALNPGQIQDLLRTCRRENICDEAVLLSTCNRTELYYVKKNGDFDLDHFLDHLAEIKGMGKIQDTSSFYHMEADSAVRHLFRVTGGMDSAVPGEHEILGQVKKAYRLGLKAGTARFLLSKLFHRAFRVGKRIQSETRLGEGATSMPAAAVELLEDQIGNLQKREALLMGAGEASKLAARACLNSGVSSMVIANRSVEKGNQLVQNLKSAKENNTHSNIHKHKEEETKCSVAAKEKEETEVTFHTTNLQSLASTLEKVDFLISGTGSSDFVLTTELAGKAIGKRSAPLYMADLAVPRDIDPALSNYEKAILFNSQDIEKRVSQNIENRKEEKPKSKNIIEEEVSSFHAWFSRLSLEPTIKQLVKRFREISEEEREKRASNFCEDDQEALQKFTRSLSKKLLHYPIAFLKEAAGKRADRETETEDMIRKMFELDEEEG